MLNQHQHGWATLRVELPGFEPGAIGLKTPSQQTCQPQPILLMHDLRESAPRTRGADSCILPPRRQATQDVNRRCGLEPRRVGLVLTTNAHRLSIAVNVAASLQ